MLFTEPGFLFLFLPLLLGLYFLLGQSLRNILLLLASLFFYAWDETFYVLVMLLSIGGNYAAGLWIDRVRGKRGERLAITVSVAANLSLLAGFKYANFVVDNVNVVLGKTGLGLIDLDTVHLPIGISFFTFQAMSYVIDVYRGDVDIQRRPLNVALYISLFPQLIAGPIVRYHDIYRQILHRHITSELFASGVRRFILGLGKKMIIANAMAVPADAIFAMSAKDLTLSQGWLAVICYTLQIYFDFSGYSDMAIGLGRMFGFRFLENFQYPYISRSITEFWRRWHISLSTWFRDYLYFPLGGNRKGRRRTYFNLAMVFVLCGLWHGASWTFVLWGLYHGAFLILERAGLSRRLETSNSVLRHIYVLIVVMVGWVLFRAESVSQARRIVAAMIGVKGFAGFDSLAPWLSAEFLLILSAGLVFSTPVVNVLRQFRNRAYNHAAKGHLPIWRLVWQLVELATLVLILAYSCMLMAAGTYNPFIYFRF